MGPSGALDARSARRVAPLAWRRCVRVLGRLAAIIGTAFGLVTFTPVVPWYANWLSGPWLDSRGDVLIVLAGSTMPDHLLGESSYWRAVYATRSWREGGFQQVVISGGPEEVDGVPAALSIKEFLVASGVPAEKLRLETYSHSTRENALFTRDLLFATPSRKVLLTSDYHMFRAARAFARVGLRVEPRPFPDVLKRAYRWEYRPALAVELTRETAKILYYRWQGWI